MFVEQFFGFSFRTFVFAFFFGVFVFSLAFFAFFFELFGFFGLVFFSFCAFFGGAGAKRSPERRSRSRHRPCRSPAPGEREDGENRQNADAP